MKITKLKRIQNFEGIIQIGDEVEFKNFNIIFGDNGSGKSRIVRAISAFADELPITKHYFHESDPSSISFEIDGDQYTYNDDGYDKKPPTNFADSLLIYDTKFISENLDISANEKGEKLITIAGYNQCFKLNNQFEETIKKLVSERDSVFSSDLKAVMAQVKSKIQKYSKTEITKDLSSLKITNGRSYYWGAKSKINELKSVRKEIKGLNLISNEKIEAKSKTIEKLDSRIKNFAKDKDNLEDFLDFEYKLEGIELDLKGIRTDFRQFLGKTEKLEYLSDYSENEISFIKSGIQLLKKDPDLCPFCKQDLIDKEQTELVEKYKEIVEGLKKDYQEDFKRNVQEYVDKLEKTPSADEIYPEKYVSKLHLVKDLIEEKPQKWDKKEIKSDKITELINFLRNIIRSIDNGLLSNIEMPSQRLIDKTIDQIISINKSVDEVESIIEHNEELFTKVKEENYAGGKEELEKKKNEAEVIVTRNIRNSEFKELIPHLNLLIRNLKECAKIDELIKSINEISDKFTSELENEINLFSEAYVKTIQKYYKHFQPDGVFNLIDADASTSKSGGRFKLRFQVSAKSRVNEKKDGKQPSEVLSDGNYNSLALAYFFALVEKQDPDIVIFDDPITGMDSSKRFQLMESIFRLEEECQIFVLTHDILFRNYLCEGRDEDIHINDTNANNHLKSEEVRYYNLFLSSGILRFLGGSKVYQEILDELEEIKDKPTLSNTEIISGYGLLRLGLEYFIEKRLVKNVANQNSYKNKKEAFKKIDSDSFDPEVEKELDLIYEACNKSGAHSDPSGGDTASQLKNLADNFLQIDTKFKTN
jgi:energy-coupling factor transporter ATP-binding protein EcfA2